MAKSHILNFITLLTCKTPVDLSPCLNCTKWGSSPSNEFIKQGVGPACISERPKTRCHLFKNLQPFDANKNAPENTTLSLII